jgi:hypothetical protein
LTSQRGHVKFPVLALGDLRAEEVSVMVNEINDAMRQYWKANENLITSKPKNPTTKGIKVPDARNLVLVVTGILVILVAIGQMM